MGTEVVKWYRGSGVVQGYMCAGIVQLNRVEG